VIIALTPVAITCAFASLPPAADGVFVASSRTAFVMRPGVVVDRANDRTFVADTESVLELDNTGAVIKPYAFGAASAQPNLCAEF